MLADRNLRQPPAEAPENTMDAGLERTLAQLRQLLTVPPLSGVLTAPPLKLIQVSVGTAIRILAVDEVVYFEAADKYVRVLTPEHEYLIRTPLRDLLLQLDPQQFWQIHRAAVVRAHAIESVLRDEAGKSWLQMRGRPERLAVSRLYSHLFKAM